MRSALGLHTWVATLGLMPSYLMVKFTQEDMLISLLGGNGIRGRRGRSV